MHFETVPLAEVPATKLISAEKQPIVVMVVDDERVIADTLVAILTRSGYAAIAAYDGESALKRTRIARPQMVITDVCMPGMGGIELAVAIRDTYPDCKILLFSGQMATVDLLVASRNAGYDFAAISKPIHPTELLARVSAFLDPVTDEHPQPGLFRKRAERAQHSA